MYLYNIICTIVHVQYIIHLSMFIYFLVYLSCGHIIFLFSIGSRYEEYCGSQMGFLLLHNNFYNINNVYLYKSVKQLTVICFFYTYTQKWIYLMTHWTRAQGGSYFRAADFSGRGHLLRIFKAPGLFLSYVN